MRHSPCGKNPGARRRADLKWSTVTASPGRGRKKEAGADATRSLKEDEPAPQTIYYRPGTRANAPVLVKVQLHYARSKSPAKKQR